MVSLELGAESSDLSRLVSLCSLLRCCGASWGRALALSIFDIRTVSSPRLAGTGFEFLVWLKAGIQLLAPSSQLKAKAKD